MRLILARRAISLAGAHHHVLPVYAHAETPVGAILRGVVWVIAERVLLAKVVRDLRKSVRYLVERLGVIKSGPAAFGQIVQIFPRAAGIDPSAAPGELVVHQIEGPASSASA